MTSDIPQNDAISGGGVAGLCAGLLVCALGLGGLVAGRFALADTDGLFVVIGPMPDRHTVTALVHGAGGGMISSGHLPQAVIAASGDPGFVQALRAGGAWVVLPVPGALGCVTRGGTAG